jgi:HlyD family secretion protein
VKTVSRKSLFAIGVALALAFGLATAAWTMFLRPIKVEIAHTERDVPVQVFGLGTVEARVTSKVGFKVSGVLVDLEPMSIA